MMENPQDGDGYSDHHDRQHEQYQKQGNRAHNVQILPLVVKTMSNSKQDAALQAVEEALALLRSAPVLEGTAKESVEVLLEVAEENLREM
jgi:ribosomal protein S7